MPAPLLVAPERAAQLRDASRTWPSVDLTPGELSDLELLLNGSFAPLRGFMSRADYEAVTRDARLADGTLWPVPVTLDLPPALQHELTEGSRVALRDREGVMLACLTVVEAWPDAAGRWRVGGDLEGIQLPAHRDFESLRKTPAQLRETFIDAGWTKIACIQALSPAPPTLLPAAIEEAAARGMPALVLLITGPAAPDDVAHYERVRAYEATVAKHERATFTLLPLVMDATESRALMLRAIVARNFGCTHLLVYGDIQEDARKHSWELGVEFVPVSERVPVLERARPEDRVRQGLTIFFTGLSGSGKSTIANAVLGRLLQLGERRVSLLDGDIVRKHLSSELGFSKEHRDLNIRRIGYVASEITKHGGIAICAPIAPYDSVRQEVRRMVEAHGHFILVYVSTPLEICEQRDRKGLYAKARAGILQQFTGISDPYEAPTDAALVIDAATMSVDAAAATVIEYLQREGYFGA